MWLHVTNYKPPPLVVLSFSLPIPETVVSSIKHHDGESTGCPGTFLQATSSKDCSLWNWWSQFPLGAQTYSSHVNSHTHYRCKWYWHEQDQSSFDHYISSISVCFCAASMIIFCPPLACTIASHNSQSVSLHELVYRVWRWHHTGKCASTITSHTNTIHGYMLGMRLREVDAMIISLLDRQQCA